jgi:hypothetical protein
MEKDLVETKMQYAEVCDDLSIVFSGLYWLIATAQFCSRDS